MVAHLVARDLEGDFRLENGGLVEVPPLGVSEQVLEVAGEPVFHAIPGLLRVGFKVGGEGVERETGPTLFPHPFPFALRRLYPTKSAPPHEIIPHPDI